MYARNLEGEPMTLDMLSRLKGIETLTPMIRLSLSLL